MPLRQYRQGDVLLVEVVLLPPDARRCPREESRWVLVHGELTGHAHTVALDDAEMHETGQDRFLDVKRSTHLLHDEHAPIELPKGLFLIVRQREYVPPTRRERADGAPEIILPGTTRHVSD